MFHACFFLHAYVCVPNMSGSMSNRDRIGYGLAEGSDGQAAVWRRRLRKNRGCSPRHVQASISTVGEGHTIFHVLRCITPLLMGV